MEHHNFAVWPKLSRSNPHIDTNIRHKLPFLVGSLKKLLWVCKSATSPSLHMLAKKNMQVDISFPDRKQYPNPLPSIVLIRCVNMVFM